MDTATYLGYITEFETAKSDMFLFECRFINPMAYLLEPISKQST